MHPMTRMTKFGRYTISLWRSRGENNDVTMAHPPTYRISVDKRHPSQETQVVTDLVRFVHESVNKFQSVASLRVPRSIYRDFLIARK